MQYTVKIREGLYDTSQKNSVSKFLDIAENASVAIKFGSTQQKLPQSLKHKMWYRIILVLCF